MPLGLLVAIAFYQFLDIDHLFSATLSYSLLAFLGLAMVLGVMPAASRVASDFFGLDPAVGQLFVAVGLAAILVPAHRILRPWIDRRLFPERATLEQGFEQLLGQISGTAEMQGLTQLVGERLDALLGPAGVVLYSRVGDLFTPLATRGHSAPPTFATQSALIATLQERTTPFAAQRWTARRATVLMPFERAAIETLDGAVLVPIWRRAELAAFWCLGPKRSGDIYTPTDLALLGAVAGTLSDRLLVLGETRSTGQPSQGPVVGEEEPATADILGISPAQTTNLERPPDRQGLHPGTLLGSSPRCTWAGDPLSPFNWEGTVWDATAKGAFSFRYDDGSYSAQGTTDSIHFPTHELGTTLPLYGTIGKERNGSFVPGPRASASSPGSPIFFPAVKCIARPGR